MAEHLFFEFRAASQSHEPKMFVSFDVSRGIVLADPHTVCGRVLFLYGSSHQIKAKTLLLGEPAAVN